MNQRITDLLKSAVSLGASAAALLATVGALCLVSTDGSELGAGRVLAQGSTLQPNDRLPPERKANINQSFYPDDEAVRIGSRMRIENFTYQTGEIRGQVRVDWRNGDGALIEGIQVQMMVMYRASEESGPSAYREVVRLRRLAKTRSNGVVEFFVPAVGENGFAPGEYYVKFSISLPTQELPVIDAMMADRRNFHEPAFRILAQRDRERHRLETQNEAREAAEARQAGKARMPKPVAPAQSEQEIRQATIDRIRNGMDAISTTQCGLFVGTSSVWIDEGTIAEVTEVESTMAAHSANISRVESVELDLKAAKEAAVKAELEEKLKIALARKAASEEAIRRLGGPLTAEELHIRQRARANSVVLRKEIAVWEDALLIDYLTLIYGDLSYWYWYAVGLHGNPVWDAVKSGKLPWEGTVPLTYGKDGKQTVKDMATYRAHLKEKMTLSVNGDPKTWPEKGGVGPASDAKRGGNHSPSMLPQILKDIDAFDIMKFLVKTAEGYELNDNEWIAFEEDFRVRIGLDPNMDDRATKLGMFAYKREDHPAFEALRAPKSTGARVRDLDMAPKYNIMPTRFLNAHLEVTKCFRALSMIPTSYRFSVYAELQKLTGKELDQRLGGARAFPQLWRRLRGSTTSLYATARADVEKLFKDTPGWKQRQTLFFYTYGRGRNLEVTETVKKQLAQAKAGIQSRGELAADGGTGEGGTATIVEEGSGSGPEGG